MSENNFNISENETALRDETPEAPVKPDPAPEKDAPKHTWRTAKRLFGQLKNQKTRLIFVVLCVIVTTALNIVAPYDSASVMDSLVEAVRTSIETGAKFTIAWNPLGLRLTVITIMYAALTGFTFLQSFLMANVAETLILTLRNQIGRKIHKLPLKFFDGNKPGEILSRVTSDLDKISETLQTGLLRFISSIGTIIGALSFMFYFSPILTLIFMGFTLISIVATKIIAGKNLELAAIRQEKVAVLTGLTEEYYTGRNVIRAYNREKASAEKMNEAIDAVAIANEKADFITNSVNPGIRFLSRLAQAVILLIGSVYMVSGAMTFGVLQAYFQYMGMCAEPLTQASYMINALQSAFASAERTFEFLDETEEVPDPTDPLPLERAKGIIAFENVSFGYTPDKLLMKNIDFTAEQGKKIAIVGATGAGKTTLINLLMRFYEVNGGRITIDGIPSTDLTRKTLRGNFGMVLQDTWLFGGTIAENIAYGKENATREEIERAAKMARIHDFILSMPQGYDTVLDNDAANISVGQRQLLTIARVFLCDPPVLILDEATSSVDTRTEAEIGKAMSLLMSGRTSFVIAHRLSTIRDADRILYMEHGDIVEQGSHAELLAKGGAYASLYNSQFE